MATHGTVSQYQQSKETWTTYVERLNHYFIANDVADEGKKRSILLSACGSSTYKLIRSLVEVGQLATTPYSEITKLVAGYYQPIPSEIVQRYKFNTRVRASGELIATYVAALRELSEYCNYGDKLHEMLRDRLVCGVNHDTIQRKLLAETDLTYEKAYTLAQAIEASERDTLDLKGSKNSSAPLLPLPEVNYSRTFKHSKGKIPTKRGNPTCYRCGGPHLAPACKFINSECKFCKKKGHIARVCRKAQQESKVGKETNFVLQDMPEDQCADHTHSLCIVRDQASDPLHVQVALNTVQVEMLLDTGASVSLINLLTYQMLQQHKVVAPLQNSSIQLRTYTGQPIRVLGRLPVQAEYMGKLVDVCVHVVEGDGPNLMGRDWLSLLEVNLGEVNLLKNDCLLQTLLNKHCSIFNDELGCMKDMKVRLLIDSTAKPKFFKPRSVPFTLRDKVETELQRLESLGIISPVKFSKWAAPIVPVVKKNGTVRICGDYKVTANRATLTESYPLPLVDELMTDLAGGKYFTKLDLSQAYLQLPLDNESSELLTINTHKGLFKYNRLPFGVSSAPAIFQRSMETLLRGLNGVSVYLDDILVTGSTHENHLHNLAAVLEQIEQAGLRLNRSKCFFLQPRLEYLGHVIDEAGRHPTEDKIRAIKEAPAPTNITELRSFLGMITYYSKFLPNMSTKLTPLYALLAKKKRWSWHTKEEAAFQLAKQALHSDAVLVHFDSSKPLILACDASQYGIGAVLSHVFEDGREKPIAYTSRTLNPAEKRYSQLEKEGLAIVSGIKKFHNFLYGRHFIIESDHRPLSFLFNEAKGIPQMASSLIQRWAITLSAYNYTICYKKGKTLCNADALSRLPRPVTTATDDTCTELVNLVQHMSSTCVSALHIKDWTTKDPLLSKVRRFIQLGWPNNVTEVPCKPYFSRKGELSVLDGCILWGTRVVIPPPGRQPLLKELHQAHPGVTKMKALARSYIWWPNMDTDIETLVKTCTECQESRPSPPTAPLHPWEWPASPWSRLHIDFAGPYLGHMFLVLVDAHSKWMDVRLMHSIKAHSTIEQLRMIFATHGIPQKIVSDNGPTFTSQEFKTFMTQNGVLHITSAPYHPSTNGLAERAVQTFKQALKRIQGSSIQEKLSKFLFQYRITPHTTTGIAPAELLMGRRLRSRLDLLFPTVSQKVESKQLKQKKEHDATKPVRTFSIGDLVYVEDFTASPQKWIPGKIVEVTGPLSYCIELLDGSTVRRHVDNVIQRCLTDVPISPAVLAPTPVSVQPVDPLALPDLPSSLDLTQPVPPLDPPPARTPTPPRRSTRTRQKPARFKA